MLRRFVGFALVVALIVPNIPVFAAPSAGAQTAATGQISGIASDAAGQKMANTTVLAREMQTAQLVGTTTSDALGQFTFTGLNPGTFVLEVVNAAGKVIATSGAITLTPAAMAATGLTVTGAATAAAVGGGSFFASTAGILMLAASGVGVMGVVVATNRTDASPSR